MAKSKKAAPRLSKEEKEKLARRAAGQIKRQKTLAMKKKLAAQSGERQEQDVRVEVAQPVLMLDASATAQYLREQSSNRDAFIPPAPACGLSSQSVGATASPRASVLLEIRQRLQDIAGQNGYILGQFAGFYERVAGSQPDTANGASDKPAANGVAYEIDALLNLIQSQGSKLVDNVHKLDTIA